jgi:hypothetical protein
MDQRRQDSVLIGIAILCLDISAALLIVASDLIYQSLRTWPRAIMRAARQVFVMPATILSPVRAWFSDAVLPANEIRRDGTARSPSGVSSGEGIRKRLT